MSTLPSGTVTFLFTDIEGSTMLAQQHPADLPGLLARHQAILGAAIEPVERASVERDLGIIHAQMDDSVYEIAYKAGRSMTMEQAIELALG